MKKELAAIGVLLLALASPAHAQKTNLLPSGTGGSAPGGNPAPEVVVYADEMPAFPGGDAAFHRYLEQKIVYPADARLQNLSGTVVVRFVIDEAGRVVDAEVVRGCGHGFDEEALRLVRLMPWWTPGRLAGRPVRVARTMPIAFRVTRQPSQIN